MERFVFTNQANKPSFLLYGKQFRFFYQHQHYGSDVMESENEIVNCPDQRARAASTGIDTLIYK